MELEVKFEETNQEFEVEFEGFIDNYEPGYVEGYNQGSLDGYDEGNADGYISGEAAGKKAEAEKCAAKHFVTTVKGSGTEQLQFHLPFEPDVLLLISFDTRNRYTNYTVQNFLADFRSLGLLCAVSQTSRSTGSPYTLAMTTTSIYQRYSRAEDGTVTLQNISQANGYATFAQGQEYTVIAAKYTDKTDKELYTDLVNGLVGSGTVEVCQAKVEAAFTEEEWAELIATKPGYTFVFV